MIVYPRTIKAAMDMAENYFLNVSKQAEFRRITDHKTVITLCEEDTVSLGLNTSDDHLVYHNELDAVIDEAIGQSK